METYKELKKRQGDEFGSFEGVFFAFSKGQFAEGMQKLGLDKEDTSGICAIGSGGYMLKSQKKAFDDMFERHYKEKEQRKLDEKFLFSALVYELRNHEFGYTYDPTDALEALGMTKDKVDSGLLKKAMSIASEDC